MWGRASRRELEGMRRAWDERARENARYYVNTARQAWSDAEFFASGERTVAEHILTDLTNICQGKHPREMRVLEIGCGAARVTRALAQVFGEVHAVDVSGEMVAQARAALRDFPHAHVHQNNGRDLRVLGELRFDFAFSTLVFQHIPSRAVIEQYVRETSRRLQPGALFRFQVQGGRDFTRMAGDTWHGVSFAEQDSIDLAERCGFERRFAHGAGTQEFWLWYFKRSGAWAAVRQTVWRLRSAARWRRRQRDDRRLLRTERAWRIEKRVADLRQAAAERRRETALSDASLPAGASPEESPGRRAEDVIAGEILRDSGHLAEMIIRSGKEPCFDRMPLAVLEVGCGEGQRARVLARLFETVYALAEDGASKQATTEAVRGSAGAQVYEYRQGEREQGLPETLRADLAFSWAFLGTLSRYEEIEAITGAVYCHLAPGGFLKFAVRTPAAGDSSKGYRFSDDALLRLALRTGFEPRFPWGGSDPEKVVYFFRERRWWKRLWREGRAWWMRRWRTGVSG